MKRGVSPPSLACLPSAQPESVRRSGLGGFSGDWEHTSLIPLHPPSFSLQFAVLDLTTSDKCSMTEPHSRIMNISEHNSWSK